MRLSYIVKKLLHKLIYEGTRPFKNMPMWCFLNKSKIS